MFKKGMIAAALGLSVIAMGVGPQVASAGGLGGDAQRNIVQVARSAGTFNTLIKALQATDLDGTLSGQGQGPFTVFAPTDAAFAKLPPGTVESLLQNPAVLKQILNGQSLTVTNAGGPKVNDAAIVSTDIGARNGIIHVIDTVLIPR